MIYFQVQEINSGKIIAGNMNDFSRKHEFDNKKNFSNVKNGVGIKSRIETLGTITVWVIIENNVDILKSSKLFKKTISLYKTIALSTYEEYKKKMQAYAHTLGTIQVQMSQEIDDFAVKDAFYGISYDETLKNISDIVSKDKESAADLICYFQKRVADFKAQLLGAEIIHNDKQYEVKIVEVRLKRAILHQLQPFLKEFDEKIVKIKFFFDDELRIHVDKNMFSLIMYNFFANALKYSRKNSEIKLNYFKANNKLDISMTSLKMEKNELAGLFNEGIRGKHAKNLPGKGIGLFVIKKALEIMNKNNMCISPNYEINSLVQGEPYVENHFEFAL